MAAAGDVTVAQEGGPGHLHPYILSLMRWCVSYLWSTATVLLHRLMIAPIQPLTGSKLSHKPRPASSEHLHPEPLVECVVLYEPSSPTMDVIFVHGLYGSLANTWRQGEWRAKYKLEPNITALRNHGDTLESSDCHFDKDTIVSHTNRKLCHSNDEDIEYVIETTEVFLENKSSSTFNKTSEDFYREATKVIPNDTLLITENIYQSTLLDQVEVVDNYESQVKFVSDLFKYGNCDKCESCYLNNGDSVNVNDNDYDKTHFVKCSCKMTENDKCEAGCGCVCDECYSHCWPKDWIKIDYPDARVLSINYTSDPHLWRPLWIKENKRLRLHERAEQMTRQLLDLGVGERPIIWVGHSKGGLFIKQIYCEAYEAYLKDMKTNLQPGIIFDPHDGNLKKSETVMNTKTDTKGESKSIDTVLKDKSTSEQNIYASNDFDKENDSDSINVTVNSFDNPVKIESYLGLNEISSSRNNCDFSNNNENRYSLGTRSSLWSNSVGFMFYSVPHRGSPLADIKTPITARSIELLEISKDCPLVLSLQSRWLRATAPSQPAVRSLVETCRTLMSVLWLRIVSVDSADPGIGVLCGVNVDHREICKPSSRRCLLYKELMSLIEVALHRCRCQ